MAYYKYVFIPEKENIILEEANNFSDIQMQFLLILHL